jgi:hypothetical protein
MNQKIDNTEKAIRLGCGGFLGLLVGIFVFTGLFIGDGNNTILFVIIISIFSTIFGILALLKGDIFWSSVKDWLNKWWI